MNSGETPFDQIGSWSEIKLDIIKEYAAAYSLIVSRQKNPSLHHIYIDAFAGSGVHISKASGEFVPGSPMNALLVEPPFREYHFIDLDRQKVAALETMARQRKDVSIYHGDCNRVLLDKVLQKTKWEDYRRALCILDPYGLHLDWKVIAETGRMGSVEMSPALPTFPSRSRCATRRMRWSIISTSRRKNPWPSRSCVVSSGSMVTEEASSGTVVYRMDRGDLEPSNWLLATVKKNVTIDWTVRENVRAQLRVIVKRILRKHGYLPDKQEKATQTVLEQAEVLSELWAVA
jgi:Domain of unknown function (DUF3387)